MREGKLSNQSWMGFFLALLVSMAATILQGGASLLIQRIQSIPEIPPQVYSKAKDAYLRNDLTETIRLLLPAGDRPENSPAAGILLGKAYFFRTDYSEAERIFQGVLRKEPVHPEAQKWLARIALSQGKGEEAERLCYRILSLDPENPEALLLLGKARLSKGDTKGALEYLEKGKANLRKLAEIPLELADLYRQFGLENRSREELELALYLLGRESSLYRAVKRSLEKLGEP
jgi:tetratricopeptide (TPR) repeat protein